MHERPVNWLLYPARPPGWLVVYRACWPASKAKLSRAAKTQEATWNETDEQSLTDSIVFPLLRT